MSVDIEGLKNGCIYQAQAPFASVQADLAEIANAEQRFIQGRRDRRRTGFFLLGGGVLSFIMGFAVSNFGLLLLLLGIGAIVASIVKFVLAYSYGRLLTNYRNRYILLGNILDRLAADSGPKAPVNVRLTLNDQTRIISEGPWPVRRKGKQTFSENDWLTVEGRLLDGTKFTQTVRELVRKRTYVNPRGKYKTKLRSLYFITVRLSYPRERYGNLQPLQPGLEKLIKLPTAAKLRSVKVSGKSIAMTAKALQGEAVLETSTMMYLGLYKALNLSRQLIARKMEGKG